MVLSNVVLFGSGFSNHIERIPAGAKHRLRVRPNGESGLRIVFDAGGRHIDGGQQGYFEPGGGYRVDATVDTNLTVSVMANLGPY